MPLMIITAVPKKIDIKKQNYSIILPKRELPIYFGTKFLKSMLKLGNFTL